MTKLKNFCSKQTKKSFVKSVKIIILKTATIDK